LSAKSDSLAAEPVKPRLALFLLLVAGCCIGALVAGASIIDRTIPGGLPLGNLLAAVGLCALAGAAFALSPPGSLRCRVTKIVLFAALLWLPLSIALARNLALDFSGTRGTLWLAATAIVALSALCSFAWATASFLHHRAILR
jgi:hypothetical protein